MLSKSAPPLRTAAASFRMQPVILHTYHTSSISHRRIPEPKSITHFKFPTSNLLKPQTRRASTEASSISPATGSTTPSESTSPESKSNPQSTTAPILTWNAFFTLRKRRRWWQMGASVISCGASTIGGIATLLRIDPNTFASAIPQIDPMFTMGAATFGFGVVGWMVGPFLGTAVWRWRNGRVVGGEVTEKEKEFFKRIKEHRVDPTGSSMQNPVPDYYGEKIGSVADYRRWLKDQRAFNKKRLASIV